MADVGLAWRDLTPGGSVVQEPLGPPVPGSRAGLRPGQRELVSPLLLEPHQ